MKLNRRKWLVSTAVAAGFVRSVPAALADQFRLKYILASSLYGTTPIDEVLGEVKKTGAEHIDLWPKVHADHREQVESLGASQFTAMLAKHDVKLGMTTRYDLGPYGLDKELEFVKQFGGRLIVTGADRTKGPATKEQVQAFAKRLQPTIQVAERAEVTVAIENHSGFLLNSLDAIRWFGEAIQSPRVGVALTPSHLGQEAEPLAQLIGDLGPKLVHFYAWQLGDGFLTKLPKEQELKQLPGRGALDFKPLLAALSRSHYDGWVEIFMHPTPRGVPILDSTSQVTAAVNNARSYLETQMVALAEK